MFSILRALSVLAAELVALIPTATSVAGATVQVLPAADAVFTCQNGPTCTVVSGSIRIVTNEAISFSGNDNFNFTPTPQNVTAASSQGSTRGIVVGLSRSGCRLCSAGRWGAEPACCWLGLSMDSCGARDPAPDQD